MTYKEYGIRLHQEVSKKLNSYFLLAGYSMYKDTQEYKEWQNAQQELNKHVAYCMTHKINIDDEMGGGLGV